MRNCRKIRKKLFYLSGFWLLFTEVLNMVGFLFTWQLNGLQILHSLIIWNYMKFLIVLPIDCEVEVINEYSYFKNELLNYLIVFFHLNNELLNFFIVFFQRWFVDFLIVIIFTWKMNGIPTRKEMIQTMRTSSSWCFKCLSIHSPKPSFKEVMITSTVANY